MSRQTPLRHEAQSNPKCEPVGNYERYSLARDNTGNPQLITYVATYASGSDVPSVQSLKLRAVELIDKYPLLMGCILDGRTTTPKWGLRSEKDLVSGMDTLVRDGQVDSLVRLA